MLHTIFSQNFNCSQSVFSAFAAQFGLDRETALKLASPFGGGVARRGEVCGAVTGALLALGLARGADNRPGRKKFTGFRRNLCAGSRKATDTVLCRDLIACDLSTPAGYQAADEKGVFTTICPVLVQDAVEIVQKMLETA